MKLTDACQKYLIDCEVRNKHETYVYEYNKCLALEKHLPLINIEHIDRDTINLYVLNHRKSNKNISNKTLNKTIAVLNRVLEYNGYDRVKYKKLREKEKRIQTVNRDEITEIKNYLITQSHRKTGKRNLLLFMILVDTGLRLKEARHLSVKTLNINELSFLVQTSKTQQERIVFFTTETLNTLIAYIEEFNITDHLFIDFKTNEIISTNSVEQVFSKIRKKLGFDKSISPHKYRHTFATEFSKKTNDIPSLMTLLGHSNIQTTEKYLHHDMEYIKSQYYKSRDSWTNED